MPNTHMPNRKRRANPLFDTLKAKIAEDDVNYFTPLTVINYVELDDPLMSLEHFIEYAHACGAAQGIIRHFDKIKGQFQAQADRLEQRTRSKRARKEDMNESASASAASSSSDSDSDKDILSTAIAHIEAGRYTELRQTIKSAECIEAFAPNNVYDIFNQLIALAERQHGELMTDYLRGLQTKYRIAQEDIGTRPRRVARTCVSAHQADSEVSSSVPKQVTRKKTARKAAPRRRAGARRVNAASASASAVAVPSETSLHINIDTVEDEPSMQAITDRVKRINAHFKAGAYAEVIDRCSGLITDLTALDKESENRTMLLAYLSSRIASAIMATEDLSLTINLSDAASDALGFASVDSLGIDIDFEHITAFLPTAANIDKTLVFALYAEAQINKLTVNQPRDFKLFRHVDSVYAIRSFNLSTLIASLDSLTQAVDAPMSTPLALNTAACALELQSQLQLNLAYSSDMARDSIGATKAKAARLETLRELVTTTLSLAEFYEAPAVATRHGAPQLRASASTLKVLLCASKDPSAHTDLLDLVEVRYQAYRAQQLGGIGIIDIQTTLESCRAILAPQIDAEPVSSAAADGFFGRLSPAQQARANQFTADEREAMLGLMANM